jgi:hypothetical protein
LKGKKASDAKGAGKTERSHPEPDACMNDCLVIHKAAYCRPRIASTAKQPR